MGHSRRISRLRYRVNEVREMRFGLEEVAKVEYVNTPQALRMDIGHEKTESARTEAATCEGEAA